MTIQGAIEELQILFNAKDIPIYYKGAIKKVIETIQMDTVPKNFHDKTCEAMAKRHTEEMQRYMWIPCSERLPEERLIVLVSFEEIYGLPSIRITYYNNGKWEDALYREVTAWMPLPKPYKEGE